MAKPLPGLRLLRSLARLVAATTPKPRKPARKGRAKTAAKTAAQLELRKPTRPAPQTAPGKWLAQYTYSQGQRMAYWLYLPDRPTGEATTPGLPLLVMLHGCQQSATEFAQGTRMNWLAEQKGFAVLYPQQALRTQAHRCWRWYEPAVQRGEAETAMLANLVRSICEQYPIDRRRIYACGLSAGAGMAAVLAINHPELIAAVAMHSGPIFGAGHGSGGALRVMHHGDGVQATAAIRHLLQRRSADGMPAMPALLIQGSDDRVVRPVNQQQLVHQWLLLNGMEGAQPTRVDSKPAVRNGSRHAHLIQDYATGRKVILRVAHIEGLGHAWSGGDPTLRFNAKPGPDASRMVLDFLAKHRR
ncbi:PHB depolymerase family esterase [Pseudoduganella sp.]|uniref:extracellular catalytic domain type 1 short-chain-length polyhydroxyalkanoate depolymerase n=1 Tax=Pseudoduganella sp. TaxID=1880898 RepID=UPI0035B345AB